MYPRPLPCSGYDVANDYMYFKAGDAGHPILAISADFAKDPGDRFDLRYWELQVPTDRIGDGKSDSHDELAG